MQARIKLPKVIIRWVTDQDSPLSKVIELAGGSNREAQKTGNNKIQPEKCTRERAAGVLWNNKRHYSI